MLQSGTFVFCRFIFLVNFRKIGDLQISKKRLFFVIGHVRCSHFHINILVFFVGLSLIVLCYLCNFFFLTLSRSFTRFHNHDNVVQTSSIHLIKETPIFRSVEYNIYSGNDSFEGVKKRFHSEGESMMVERYCHDCENM
jgi:hypothetical protein